MKTEVMLVTPEIAAGWLAKNKSNRQLRSHTVAHYARQMRAGEWQLTHQGILIDGEGNLADGQHRLSAIVQADTPVHMAVTMMDLCTTALAMPLDIGLTRTYTDVLDIPRKHIEVVRLVHEVAHNGTRFGRLSPGEAASVHRVLQSQIEALPTAVHSALCSHRVATVLAAMLAPSRADEIREQSSWWVTGSNCKQWWSSVEAFSRFCKQAKPRHWNGTNGRLDYIMRWRMAMLQPDLKISRIMNEVLLAREIREQCKDILTSAGVKYE